MLMKTSIILFLMLITFSVGAKGWREENVLWSQRMPSRLQNKNITNIFQPYILNGTPADIKDYPFKLSLRVFEQFVCGATVIGGSWALTAAHCLEWRVSPDLITLYGGSSNRNAGGTEFNVEAYYIHPDFDPVILDYDVGVIKIKGSFDGHPVIRRSVIANENCETPAGVKIRLAGWGLNEESITPEELQEIQQYTVDNEKCYNEWKSGITSRMLCANVEEGIDSCNGGAALKGCLQVGIISFGSTECGYPVPSVFTRLEDPAIRGFIRAHTGI